jgi:hypothetical protein
MIFKNDLAAYPEKIDIWMAFLAHRNSRGTVLLITL